MNEFPLTDSPQKVGENSFFFFLKMSSFTLEREHIKMREGREGENLQAGSRLDTEPNVGLVLQLIRSWSGLKPKIGCSTDWATKGPQ